MRHSRNIFEGNSYRGTGIPTTSATQVMTIVLSVISLIVGIAIIANFNEITAKIAIGMADFLSSGFPILIVILVVGFLMARLRWRIRRSFWGW